MKELFSNEINELVYNISSKGIPLEPSELPVATLYVGANTGQMNYIGEELDVSLIEEGKYKVIVPTTLIQKKKLAKVVFSYHLPQHGYFDDSKIYNVAQRLVSFEDFNENVGRDDTGELWGVDWEDYNKTEQITRAIIEAYCHQKFNFWQGTQTVYGAIGSLFLPQHMEKLDSVLGGDVKYDFDLDIPDGYIGGYVLSNNGMSVVHRSNWTKQTIIYRPNSRNVTMTVTGLWGFEGIPSAVEEAAMEVMRFVRSDDFESRRKFVLNANGAGDVESYSFNFGAYRDSTGNPVADELLAPYRVFIVGTI